jgi:carbon-monoxide dehydrogenase small subunit
MIIRPIINGKRCEFSVKADEMLLDVLRREGVTDVKEGCREGECGACVVLLDGEPVNSCLLLAPKADEREITTVAGLGTVGNPHPLQKIFVEEGAVQCGFCTPGLILSTKALLDRNPSPDEDEIREALDGHLCRCTGYVKILNAVRRAAKEGI